jgi:molybdopterin synthase sulfur carrier subunit
MPPGSSATVLLFARYAELVGAEQVELPVEPGSDVRRLLQGLRAGHPGAAALPDSPLCAINHRQARLGDPVHPGDVVAFLPPLAGG